MNTRTLCSVGLSSLLLLTASVTADRASVARALPVPVAAGSGMYSLAGTADGQAYLSWIEPDGAGHALKFSRLEQDAWSPARLVVSWLERRAGETGMGDLRVRHVRPDGRVDPSLVVATTTAGRAAGMPQMIRAGDRLVLAWRHGDRVESATVPLPRILESSERPH